MHVRAKYGSSGENFKIYIMVINRHHRLIISVTTIQLFLILKISDLRERERETLCWRQGKEKKDLGK